MAHCPNKNLESWKLLVASRGEVLAYYLWDKYEGKVPESESNQSIVKANLKAVQILNSDKAKQVFDKGHKNNWTLDKILSELAIPKEQKELIKELNQVDLDKNITDLLANYSYTVEVNTAKEQGAKYHIDGFREVTNVNGRYFTIDSTGDYDKEISKEEYDSIINIYTINNSFY